MKAQRGDMLLTVMLRGSVSLNEMVLLQFGCIFYGTTSTTAVKISRLGTWHPQNCTCWYNTTSPSIALSLETWNFKGCFKTRPCKLKDAILYIAHCPGSVNQQRIRVQQV